jgi:NADPH-dependent glutamate synthase beta subunit-like oxidoreductase
MALLNKNPKAKPLVARPSGSGAGQVSSQRPSQSPKRAPCLVGCPSGNDVRGWLTVVAQRGKLGLGLPEALEAAWKIMVETNPLPAVMGRVCPAPCEGVCNRKEKDGAVSINATEKWIGDWALGRKLPLPRAAKEAPRRGKVAVVGAGPAGLSAAYQLARRGHAVTLLDAASEAGGLLRSFVPASKLPLGILDAEITRILDLGVTLRLSTRLGDGVSLKTLRAEFDAVCVASGEAAPNGTPGAGIFHVPPAGDVAAAAIENGRRTAAEVDAMLSGVPLAVPVPGPTIGPERIKHGTYAPVPRVGRATRTPEELAADPLLEADLGITEEQLLVEADRCYSCGMCFDCERCWMFCQNEGFRKVPNPTPGHYYSLMLDACNGCKKCANICPSGFIDWA